MEFQKPRRDFYNPKISDHLGTPILNERIFEKVLLKYYNSGSFYFIVKFEDENSNESPISISPQVYFFPVKSKICI